MPILRVEAERIDPATAIAVSGQAGARLLYLGQSNGTTVIWDASHQHTLLIPASIRIELTSHRSAPSTDAHCRFIS